MNNVITNHQYNYGSQTDQVEQGSTKHQSVQAIKQQLLNFTRAMQNLIDVQAQKVMPYIEAESGLLIAKGHRCPCRVYLVSPQGLKYKYKGQIQDPNLFYCIDFQAQLLAETLVNRMIQHSDQQVLDCERSLRQLNDRFLQEIDLIQGTPSSVLDKYELYIECSDYASSLNLNDIDLSNDLNLEMPDELLQIKKDLDQELHRLEEVQNISHKKLGYELQSIKDLIISEEQDFQSEAGETVIDPLGVYKSRRHYSHNTQSFAVLKQAKPNIELYALKIALCAENMKTSLIGLSNKVLVHELSHWNTHLGLDSDLYTWLGFHDADQFSIEGSAQDLTLRSLERMTRPYFSFKPARRRLAVLSLLAFYQLNIGQSKPYRIHRDWLHYAKNTRRQAFQMMRLVSSHDHDPICTYKYILQGVADLKATSLSQSNSIPF